jgi:hypothetical protein
VQHGGVDNLPLVPSLDQVLIDAWPSLAFSKIFGSWPGILRSRSKVHETQPAWFEIIFVHNFTMVLIFLALKSFMLWLSKKLSISSVRFPGLLSLQDSDVVCIVNKSRPFPFPLMS